MQNDIKLAFEALCSGGVILFPSATGWLLGCDATNPKAVDKLLAITAGVQNQPFTLLLINLNSIPRYLPTTPDIALDILEMSTKPTIVFLEHPVNIAANLTEGYQNIIGAHVPSDTYSQALLARFRKPIATISANPQSTKPVKQLGQIPANFIQQVQHIASEQYQLPHIATPSILKIDAQNRVQIIQP